MDDPRRQPTEHMRMVHGNIPAGWLNGLITEAAQAGREGFMLDPYLSPGSGLPPVDPPPVDPPVDPPIDPPATAPNYTLQNNIWSLLTVPANGSALTVGQTMGDLYV